MGNKAWVRRTVTALGPAAAFGLVATPPAQAAEPDPGPEEARIVADDAPASTEEAPVFAEPTSAHRPVPSLPGSIAEASVLDIPGRAAAAYQRTETLLALAAPDCHLDWELLAGVGRVESGHGERRWHELTETGLVQPAVVGRKLDGTRETTLVADTDGGEYDGDATYDRAIGPMKLLPASWTAVAVDSDGDGHRDPQDIDDAALGAGLLLCANQSDLADPAQRAVALRRLNDDRRYVRIVVRFAAAYAEPVELPATLQIWTPAPTLLAPLPDPGKDGPDAKDKAKTGGETTRPPKSGAGTKSPAPTTTSVAPAPVSTPASTPAPPTVTPDPTPEPTIDPTPEPTVEPAPDPTPEPEPTQKSDPAPATDATQAP